MTRRLPMLYSAGGRRGVPTFMQQMGVREVFGLSRQGAVNHREGYSLAFVMVVAVFVSALISANITAVKLVEVFGLVLPAAVIVFPISYICGDVLTEVYGYRAARRVIWLGFLCNLLVVLTIYIGQILPAASFWEAQEAYERILGYAPRLLAASFVAYLVGEFANAIVLAKMKVATNGRFLWSRTIGSTLVGQGLDSLVFIILAFVGTIPASALLAAIVTQWLVKSAYEALATPLTYVVVNRLKRTEGLDVYDRDTSFNPLLVGR
ncbi:MAG TPA: queuosine precursor transporter [Rubrobacteraceae bacterium]|nr:queuosine precursor transporter [Rubrobacteraceae bacterium]